MSCLVVCRLSSRQGKEAEYQTEPAVCAIAVVGKSEDSNVRGSLIVESFITLATMKISPLIFRGGGGSYRCHAYVHVESQSKLACRFEMSTTTAKNSLIRVNTYSIDMCIVSSARLMRAKKLTYISSLDLLIKKEREENQDEAKAKDSLPNH